jgi:hypothetical protein
MRILRAHTAAELCATPPRAQCEVDSEGAIVCDRCGQRATTIHLLPGCVDPETIAAACPDHDPGGYWFPVSDLAAFAPHLAGKRGRVLPRLFRWLDPALQFGGRPSTDRFPELGRLAPRGPR